MHSESKTKAGLLRCRNACATLGLNQPLFPGWLCFFVVNGQNRYHVHLWQPDTALNEREYDRWELYMTNDERYDSVHMGRSSIDLYSDDVGAPFVEITKFAAYVGGSPLNISVGGKRLGLNTVALTALGADPVGDFILHFLHGEGVETAYIPRKPGHRTSAVVLGIEPPDRFPLVYYRDNCADIELTIDDVLASPVTRCKVFQFAGTNLSNEPSRSATFFAAEQARAWPGPSCRWWILCWVRMMKSTRPC